MLKYICYKMIAYKKTEEWYIVWQRVETSGTKNDNEWQRLVLRVKTSGTTNDSEYESK